MKTELVIAVPRDKAQALLNQGQIIDGAYVLDAGTFINGIAPYCICGPRHLFEKGGEMADTYVHFASYITVIRDESSDKTDQAFNDLTDQLAQGDVDPGHAFNGFMEKLKSSENETVTRSHVLYSRNPSGGEALLHGSLSIGIGGHINPLGGAHTDTKEQLTGWLGRSLFQGALSELEEELLGEDLDIHRLNLTHVVWDKTNEVGRYHLGFFGYYIDVELMDDLAVVNFPDGTHGVLEKEEGMDQLGALESWSRIMLSMIATGIMSLHPERV